MSDHAHTSFCSSIDAAAGWSHYVRFYAWRFS
jgi:hypothetical protein